MKLFRRKNSISTESVDRNLKAHIEQVKEEFEEHLLAINENTNEISQNQEIIYDIERKMDAMREQLDHISLFLKEYGFSPIGKNSYHITPLTSEEKKVFLGLYSVEEEKGAVTYVDIARFLGTDLHLVAGYVTSLIEKGVPVVKRYVNNVAYLRLDQEFKQLQAKENLLQIDRSQKRLVQYNW